MLQVLADRRLQRRRVAQRFASDTLLGDRREEPLVLGQPRAAPRREMQVMLRVPQEESPLHRRRLVSHAVVEHQVDLDAGPFRHRGVDHLRGSEEFPMAMAVAVAALADDLAGSS